MHPFVVLALAAQAQAAPDEQHQTIVVTASREPVALDEAGVSTTVLDSEDVRSAGLALTSDVLRLVPGISVSTSGPHGSQTQLRIRGAEANHTLLFVDGIRFNDPAAGNEARFELLTNDALSRVEVVRGPQSALWGSEALGGVVSIETADPARSSGISGLAEYGTKDSARASAAFATQMGKAAVSGSAGWLSSDGIDSFGGNGERDGFRTGSGSLKAVFRPSPATEFGIVGHYVDGESEFDGFDPITFHRADTRDSTRNRIAAVRAWAGTDLAGWSLTASASVLDSANRNRLADAPLNSTFGRRSTLGAQISRSFGRHRLTAAVEHEKESFRARDRSAFGAADQDRSRQLTAIVGEWRARWSERLITDLAIRHDDFTAFAGATTIRAMVRFSPVANWTAHAGYGEGIAQPTFYDLYGFFPSSFAGNPALRAERSRGYEAGLRWQGGGASAGATLFSNRLTDEIVDTFDPVTFLSGTTNANGKSRRRGIELDAQYRPGAFTIGGNYTLLDAGEQRVAGAALLREVRRPRHSANLFADASLGRLGVGAALSYVGARTDTDFDLFPAPAVRLHDYMLGSFKVRYRLSPRVEVYARMENAFDAHYQDVVGYNTPGRTAYAGLRIIP